MGQFIVPEIQIISATLDQLTSINCVSLFGCFLQRYYNIFGRIKGCFPFLFYESVVYS